MFNEGEEFSVEEIRTATGIGHISINGYCRISVSCTSRFTWSFLSHPSQRTESSGVHCSPWPAEKPASSTRTPVGKMLRTETVSISTMNLNTSCSVSRSIRSKWRKRYWRLFVSYPCTLIFSHQVILGGKGPWPKIPAKAFDYKMLFSCYKANSRSKNETYHSDESSCFAIISFSLVTHLPGIFKHLTSQKNTELCNIIMYISCAKVH